jgi:hypothetical protein
MGTGYNKDVRMLGDFGSQLYLISSMQATERTMYGIL